MTIAPRFKIPSLERIQKAYKARGHTMPWCVLDRYQIEDRDDHFQLRWPGIRKFYRVEKS